MFTGQLFETQVPAAEKLCNRRRMLLAWEQGTGKTIISVAAAEKLFELGKAKHALVLAQPGNAWQWADKIDEFTTSEVVLAQAKDKSSRTYRLHKSLAYYVVPWSLFRRDYDILSKRNWDIVIADEAQEFKNYTTKTAQLVKKLNVTVKPAYRWALTGTAVSNKLEELYSIMYWVDPKFLPPWPIFRQNHLVLNELGMITGYKNLKELNAFLERRMDRKTHADQKGKMPTLMPPIVHKIEADRVLVNKQKKLLAVLDDMVANLVFDDNGELQGIPKSSKAAKAFHEVRALLASARKLKYAETLCHDILRENPTNKVVFFSFYKEPLYKLRDMLGPQATIFTGDQDASEKRQNVKAFLAKGGPRVLLCSNAGAAGLDLYNANYVIHIDVPPSHGILDQRNKRITRISSVHSTAVVHFLIIEDSIEEFYYQVVLNKGKLAAGTLEGEYDEVTVRPSSLRKFIRDADEDSDLHEVKAPVRVNRRKVRAAKSPAKRRNTRKAS